MALLGLLELRKILIHILDVDERPSEVVAGADAAEPGSFDGETGCAVKVAYCFVDAWDLIHVVDSLIRVRSTKELHVL